MAIKDISISTEELAKEIVDILNKRELKLVGSTLEFLIIRAGSLKEALLQGA